MNDDRPLLQAFVGRGSRRALEQLVERYLGLVYSSALRQLRDPHRADDATQAVFLILTRKAASIRHDEAVGGWLLAVTRSVVVSSMRKQAINQKRERLAARPEALEAAASAWEEMAPVVDAELNRLPRADRDAIVLRYFENHTFAAIGARLGVSEEAARQRVRRGVARLRSRLRHLHHPTILGAALSAFAVQQAPGHLLAWKIVAGVLAPAPHCLSLARGATQMIAYGKAKLAAAMAACVVMGGVTTVLFSAATPKSGGISTRPSASGGSVVVQTTTAPAGRGMAFGGVAQSAPVPPALAKTTQMVAVPSIEKPATDPPLIAPSSGLPGEPPPALTPAPAVVLTPLPQQDVVSSVPGPTTAAAPEELSPSVQANAAEGQAVEIAWSSPDMDATWRGKIPFHGPFGGETVNVSAAKLGPHAYLEISFDLLILRSWDGSVKVKDGRTIALGPDFFRLGIHDGPTLLHTSFSNMPSDPGFHPESKFQNYPSQVPGLQYPPQTGATAHNTLGYYYPWEGAPRPFPMDAVYHMHYIIPHQEPKVVVQLSGFTSQNLIDESWGATNMQVALLSADAVRIPGASVIAAAFDKALDPQARDQPEAFQTLILGGDGTARWIQQNVRPRAIDAQRAGELIKLLGADDFQIAAREAAVGALCNMGPEVEPYLRTARRTAPGDQRLRIDWVLQNISITPITDPNVRRIALATRVLEVIGTPSAAQVSRSLTESSNQAVGSAGVRGSAGRASNAGISGVSR